MIGNCQSKNWQSAIDNRDNRQSTIDNRQTASGERRAAIGFTSSIIGVPIAGHRRANVFDTVYVIVSVPTYREAYVQPGAQEGQHRDADPVAGRIAAPPRLRNRQAD